MKHALCVGINAYGNGNDLQGCVNDAHDWGQALSARGFAVATMLDKQATLANMVQRMTAAIAETNRGDTLVITYSGHGTWTPDTNGDEPDGRDEALCPVDVFDKGPLGDDDLYRIFTARNRGARIVFISDSCHSGSVSRFANFGGEAQESKVRFLAPEHFLNSKQLKVAKAAPRKTLMTLPLRTSALLLAGCQDYEYSYDASFAGRANGAFTYAALDSLKSLPAGATYRDWMLDIRKSLPSQSYPQSPIISGTSDQRRWEALA